ncbi:hypothetical protein RIF29_29829 [Crotalaria pallida]|uniref:Uncharacterized protein n=1 Tax=Crotalaria pallida TaxID=3830 RepID=A0AAN9EFL2_CROPI
MNECTTAKHTPLPLHTHYDGTLPFHFTPTTTAPSPDTTDDGAFPFTKSPATSALPQLGLCSAPEELSPKELENLLRTS